MHKILLLLFHIFTLCVWISDETLLLVFKKLPFSVWISQETLLLVFKKKYLSVLRLDIRGNTPSSVLKTTFQRLDVKRKTPS